MRNIVIVADCAGYRIRDFVDAAAALRCRAVVAAESGSPVADDDFIAVDFTDPDKAAQTIAAAAPDAAAIVAADDAGAVIVSLAAELLGLPANLPSAAAATRDKLEMRRLLSAAGVAQPEFRWAPAAGVVAAATELGLPVVIKPRRLSASRGVIRADDLAAVERAARWSQEIAASVGHDSADGLLIEEYVPGFELALEGILEDGRLDVLALIDKPVPLVGPYFAETILVTPSRLPDVTVAAVVDLVAAGCRALGLTTGPVHAEVRIPPDGDPRLIEIAARTIGGLCGRSITFGLLGESLETVVLRSALGEPNLDLSPARPASGVMMLPVENSGILDAVEGVAEVADLPGITAVEITAPRGRRIAALPEADRYLGFVFAAGGDAAEVEAALRAAAAGLTVVIDGEATGLELVQLGTGPGLTG